MLKISSLSLAIAVSFSSVISYAGNLKLETYGQGKEIYTDNINYTKGIEESSNITDISMGLVVAYDAKMAELNADASVGILSYSHGIENKKLVVYDVEGKIYFWPKGMYVFTENSKENKARNNTHNALADPLSGETEEVKISNVGLGYEYNVDGIYMSVSGGKVRDNTQFGLGESEGESYMVVSLGDRPKSKFFWALNGDLSKLNNGGKTQELASADGKLGYKTTNIISPFVQFYFEDVSGGLAVNTELDSSSFYGLGIRVMIGADSHIDVAYNEPLDKDKNNEYVSTDLKWGLSKRTKLNASYSKRFFGDSYELMIEHASRKLSNSIRYTESLSVFNRDFYSQVLIDTNYCPINYQSFVDCQSESGKENLLEISEYTSEFVQSDELVLSKNIDWVATLTLKRTQWFLRINAYEMNSLETDSTNTNITVNLEVRHKLNETLHVNAEIFRARYEFTDRQVNSSQVDFYNTLKLSFDTKLNTSLTLDGGLQHVEHESSQFKLGYEESRVWVGIKKGF
jgi:uncharacterized protein (PEP-CTERM system associated)